MAPTQLKDRVPPHNAEAEQAVLGAILLDPDSVPLVLRFLRPEDFYVNANKNIFSAIISLYEKGQKPDLITLTDELRLLSTLDVSGGASYVADLTSSVPSSANVEYYARIVQETSVRRNLLRLSQQMTSQVFDESIDSGLMLDEAQSRIFDISQNRQAVSYKSVKELLPDTIKMIEKLFRTKTPYTGIPSGFPDLDAMTSGFQESELTIIGARPSQGKTALALTIAAYTAIHEKIPTAFFSLEMADTALMQRMVASEARIASEKIRTGLMKNSDFQSLIDAAGRIYDAPLYIVDMPNMKLLELRTLARRLRTEKDVRIIFVDYLTLITHENADLPRWEQIASISRSLKALARELKIPVIALSQLKREAEGKQPTMADLRESGSIEQDADLILFLHRDRELQRSQEDRALPIPTELIVAKQRNGPTGIANLLFLPAYTRFESVEKH
jgi:replicative DNA helicase